MNEKSAVFKNGRYFDVINSGGTKKDESYGLKKSERPENPEGQFEAIRLDGLEDR